MKTLHKFALTLVLVGSTASLTFAGPPPDFWMKRSAPTPVPAMKSNTAEPSARPERQVSALAAEGSALVCKYMVVPNTGAGFSISPLMTVRCTPEMMKNNLQCQQACARAAKG
jgi:hypothetical protein